MKEFDSVRGASGLPGDRSRSVADGKWRASNRLVSDYVSVNRQRLSEAIRLAWSIRDRLTALYPIMADLCRSTCPWCPEPCCIVNRVWFDFRDVLFFHMTAVPLPPGPLGSDQREACRYLTPRGCALSQLQRPWGCTQYVCATQRRFLAKSGGQVAMERLDSEIQGIAAARIAMEETVARVVDR
ncbi:MAG: hypothetical protein PVG78_08680 [Desulfobacterales bacterium]|jgi:hypothetical protein